MTDQLVDTYDGLDHPSAVFVTKIAVVIRDDLPVWQKLNMTAFLASGVAGLGAGRGRGGLRRRGRHPLLADVRPTGDGVRGRRGPPGLHP